MPFRQIHRLTSAKLMIFIGYQIIIPLFFSFYPKKLRKSPPPCPRSSLPPSIACLLLAPVPPCLQHCLPPPFPRSRKFSSGLQLRAPSLVLPPFPPSLRFITRSPLFAYTFLVHTSAFPFVLFGSPISILLRPHPYCLVLPFSMLTVVFYSFPLLSLFFFPLSPCSSSPPITLQVHKIPLFSPCEIQKYPNFVTYHHFFHENLLAFQNLGIYFAPRNRNNEILSLLVSPVSLVSLVLPFHLPPRHHRGGR